MRFVYVGCALVLGVCAWSGCTKSPDPGGGTSETHFLLLCSDEVCSDGLSCICGACTQACSSDTRCDELASGASCMDPAQASCGEARSCDVECEANADCAQLGADHKCEDGRCRAIDRSYVDMTPPGGPDGGGSSQVTYGPCGEGGSSCGGGDWLALSSSTGQCLCTVSCETSADCPRAISGTAEAECSFDDEAVDGQRGECELPCDQGERCPDGAACVGGACRFPSGSGE
jgi:hypothetical protein